jgi:hypothetical protein
MGNSHKNNFGRVYSTKVWLQLAQWFLRRRFLCEFPIGSYVKEPTEPISTKLCWNDPWVVPFQNCVHQGHLVSKMAAYVKLSSAAGAILIEGPNRRTHFWKRTIQWLFHCWNDPWVVPFQSCVRQHRPVSKMATITKNRNFFNESFQQSLVEIGSVVSEEKIFF